MEHSDKSRQHGVPLLLHGREITTDAAKGGGPHRTTEGTSNLLLDFCHPKIALCLTVGERNGEVIKQSQHLIRPRQQGIEKILCLALLPSAFLLERRRHGGRRLSGIAGSQDLKIARDPFVALNGGNRGQLEETPLLARVVQIEQEILHLHGPLLMLLLGDSRTISHEVCSTDTVSTVIGIIAGKSVVHAPACKAWPDADLVQSISTSRRMPAQMRELAGAVHMQPMKHAIDADAGLISMLQSTPGYQIGDALDGWGQSLCCQFTPLHQACFRDLASADRRERFARASDRKQLPLVQIHCQCLHRGAILHWRTDRGGKGAVADPLTGRTTHRFDLMLLDQQADFWQIQHLTTVCKFSYHRGQRLLTMPAHCRAMADHFIGSLHPHQCVSTMSWLPSWGLSTRTACRSGQAGQPIRRWRLRGRLTIFCQPPTGCATR